MSWLEDFTNPDGSTLSQRKKFVDEEPKVKDAMGRMVSKKTANQPFLAHKEWREKEEARKAAKAQRKKERAERLARGEKVGPEEPDDEEREIGCLGILKFLISAIAVALLASKFITGDWLWGYRGKWTNINTYLPTSQQLFSEETLAKFDGSNPDLPIYIAIDSTVYDVTAGKRIYGKGGSYNHMAGVDSTRAYGTGCFETHRTHDLRGLTEAELNGVKTWIQFFVDHPTYRKIGKVIHPPIDPDTPPPPHCKPPKPDIVEAPKPSANLDVQREEL